MKENHYWKIVTYKFSKFLRKWLSKTLKKGNYYTRNLTMEKLNLPLLSNNLVENCPSLIVIFRSKSVVTLSFAFSLFNSNSVE